MLAAHELLLEGSANRQVDAHRMVRAAAVPSASDRRGFRAVSTV
jgi:hypothetical protein